LHSFKVTVWCAVTHALAIGPYFFEDEHGAAVRLTAEGYNMLMTFFIPELQRLGVTQMWSNKMVPPVTRHDYQWQPFEQQFPWPLISIFGHIHWPSRSPDLNSLHYFLWGYLKERVYLGKPRTALELEQSIRREIAAIPADALHSTALWWGWEREPKNVLFEVVTINGM
jgi:hypothetical protein